MKEFTHRICVKGYEIYVTGDPPQYSIRYGNHELAVTDTEAQAMRLIDLFAKEGRTK